MIDIILAGLIQAASPQQCASESMLQDRVDDLKPFMSEAGQRFLIGKIGKSGVLFLRNGEGRYCHAVTLPHSVYSKILKRYHSWEI